MYIYIINIDSHWFDDKKKVGRQEATGEGERERICSFCKVGKREKKARIRVYVR
jgi:hypothetical protein